MQGSYLWWMFPGSQEKCPDRDKGPTASLLDTVLLYVPVVDNCSPQPSSYVFNYFRDIFKEFRDRICCQGLVLLITAFGMATSLQGYRFQFSKAGESSQPVHSPLPDNTSSPRTAGSHHTLARWSSFSVFTPNREILVLFKLELCINFFTPLICVMSCCFFFFSLSFWVGEGISTSFCLSGTKKGEMSQHHLHCEHPSHPSKSTLSFADKWLCTPVPTTMFLLGAFSHLGTELKQNQSRTATQPLFALRKTELSP